MTGKTHLAFGVGISAVAAGCIYPNNLIGGSIMMGACMLGSILPDIDNHKSMVGNKVELLSRVINKMFGHRNLIHSPIFIIGMYFLGKWLIDKYQIQLYGTPALYGFITGYISHILLDCMTRGGIPLLYPISRKRFKFTPMKSGKGYEGIIAGGMYALVTMCFIFYTAFSNYI